jgi:hypothetical protein
MVLTRSELVQHLHKEVRILQHLASKIDPRWLDYRPTPKQRSILELMRYLSFSGPALVRAALAGDFAPAPWNEAEREASNRTLDEAVAAIGAQPATYSRMLGALSDADVRAQIVMWGTPMTRGEFLVEFLLGGCAAYRMQLFLYLKACGREELNTWNLWDGMDPPSKASP